MSIRFWNKVEKTNTCWLWKGAKDKQGYGQFKINKKQIKAHRVAWTLLHGEIPDKFIIMHSCDNPPCCNPDHLKLGTPKDNAMDRSLKGRSYGGGPKLPAKGEKNGSAKLTEIQVKHLRQLFKNGVSKRALSEIFNVSRTNIKNIVNNTTWSLI